MFSVEVQVEGLRLEVKGLRQEVRGLGARLDELRALPGVVEEAQQAEIATLQRVLEEVRARLDRLEGLIESRQADATRRFMEIGEEFGRVRDEFGRVRDEIGALRTVMDARFESLRQEINGVRKEVDRVRDGVDALRADLYPRLDAKVRESRDELFALIQSLRTEVSRMTWALSFGFLLAFVSAIMAWFFSRL